MALVHDAFARVRIGDSCDGDLNGNDKNNNRLCREGIPMGTPVANTLANALRNTASHTFDSDRNRRASPACSHPYIRQKAFQAESNDCKLDNISCPGLVLQELLYR